MKKYKFKVNGQSFQVQVDDFNGNNTTVHVNGVPYDVQLEGNAVSTKTPVLARKPVVNQPGEGKIQKSSGSGGFKVISPLPGSIFKLNVKVGDVVSEGDCLLVMEAMKMENNVLSEKSGTITAVHVKLGDTVLQGDTLVEIG